MVRHAGLISIHPPRGGWDQGIGACRLGGDISIHPPRGGWDSRVGRCTVFRSNFNPPTPWGVGLGEISNFRAFIQISIHPPRGGWDGRLPGPAGRSRNFNPPTPWGVGPSGVFRTNWQKIFQSTHPVGGGTAAGEAIGQVVGISIHPPRGGWDTASGEHERIRGISIHPPRGGWDNIGFQSVGKRTHFNPPTPWGVGRKRYSFRKKVFGFQSTHPVGGGTAVGDKCQPVDQISIHPPRGGWDTGERTQGSANPYFNPPTPWGVGHSGVILSLGQYVFQSTHPVGGGTRLEEGFYQTGRISIHPPRGGWDIGETGSEITIQISIHPPRGGVGRPLTSLSTAFAYFNPPTPWGVGPCRSSEAP